MPNNSGTNRQLAEFAIWTRQLNFHPIGVVKSAVYQMEQAGFHQLWFGETSYREPFCQAAILLSFSSSISVGIGVASIYSRTSFDMTAARETLGEAFPGRIVVGVGVSHSAHVVEVRGLNYARPLAEMKNYLDGMRRSTSLYMAPKLSINPPTLIGALGPRMVSLAKIKADGVITYLTTPEHTQQVRTAIGKDKILCVEQAVVIGADLDANRTVAKNHLKRYFEYKNYVNHWRRIGLERLGPLRIDNDSLIDELVVHGTPDDIARRLHKHLEAGADQVCLQVLSESSNDIPLAAWSALGKLLIK